MSTLWRSWAHFGHWICSSYLNSSGLNVFNACRLVPLDKSPGVQPIGVVEVCRRIIGEAVSGIVKLDIIELVARHQF